MRRWVVPVFVALAAFSSALPANSVDRVKRADETVMFGNQQNSHKTVKKSGPVPLNSKLMEKQAKVADSHALAAIEDDPVKELAEMMASKPASNAQESDSVKDLHTLISQGDSEPNAPLIEEENKLSSDLKEKKDINMGDKPKRTQPINEDSERQDYDNARYLYLLKKYGPGPFMLENESGSRRRKRAATTKLTGTRLNRIRRDMSKMASESHMSMNSVHRKKRDIEDMDPDQLARLEYMLSRSNDGYEVPEEVVDPSYGEDDVPLEYDPLEVERRGMIDDYSRYAVAKRVPDIEEAPEEVEDEEETDPVSVYESEYGPVTYGLVEHEGVPGLFVPLEQESMRRLMAAEEKDRDNERSRLRVLSTILSLNQGRK